MPGPKEHGLQLSLALIGSISALVGSLIGVGGTVAASEFQADRQDANRVRDKREELYTRVLNFQRSDLDAPVERSAEHLKAALEGTPVPQSPALPLKPDATDADREAADYLVRYLGRDLEARKLFAELEVYGSLEVLRLWNDYFEAQVEELGAVADAVKSDTDDDTDADRLRQEAIQRKVAANSRMSQQVRSEVVGEP